MTLLYNGDLVERQQWRETRCRDCPRRFYIRSEVMINDALALVWRETLPAPMLCEVCYSQAYGQHHQPGDPADVEGAGVSPGKVFTPMGSAGYGAETIPAGEVCGIVGQ